MTEEKHTRNHILEGRHISKSFGGLAAIKDVSFHLDQGEIVGLIGPNGAGKTTLFNVISGVFPPDNGGITFFGQDITSRKPVDVCRAGIARTFQIVRPFLKMNCLENVLVGIVGRGKASGRTYESKKERIDEAVRLLKFMGLENREKTLATHLTLMEKKRLEMARALATNPKVLLLDEVLAGLNPTEILQALELIEVIRSELKITIFWIKHVMGAIMKASHRVIVLDQGQLLMEGKPEDVVSNERVIEAYLGEEHA